MSYQPFPHIYDYTLGRLYAGILPTDTLDEAIAKVVIVILKAKASGLEARANYFQATLTRLIAERACGDANA